MATYFREYTDGEGNVYREYSTSDGTWNAMTKVNCTKVAEPMSDITKELATDICKKALGCYADDEIVTLCAGKGNWVPEITNVIFNDPATIVFWADGTKTVVKAQTTRCDTAPILPKANPFEARTQDYSLGEDLVFYMTDRYDREKGLAMAIAKKALGNTGNYYKVFRKYLDEPV